MAKKIFAIVMIVSVLGLLVGGCGSSDSGGDKGGATAGKDTAGGGAKDAPKDGGK